MNTTKTTQQEAVDIIQRHYSQAWRVALMARHYDMTGRHTKAKERDRQIAEAVSAELKKIVDELRQAGYEIPE